MSDRSDTKPQNYKNHARFDPLFHFFLVPALMINLVFCFIHASRHQTPTAIWMAVMSIVLFALAFLVRIYPLKAQDRTIRLEERMRLTALCDASFRPRIYQLTPRQLIGLRFASDEELPELAARALDENLSEKQIKQAIQDWRADYCRI
jgi:hypothetical protein